MWSTSYCEIYKKIWFEDSLWSIAWAGQMWLDAYPVYKATVTNLVNVQAAKRFDSLLSYNFPPTSYRIRMAPAASNSEENITAALSCMIYRFSVWLAFSEGLASLIYCKPYSWRKKLDSDHLNKHNTSYISSKAYHSTDEEFSICRYEYGWCVYRQRKLFRGRLVVSPS